jgi:hypothetical protein
MPLPLRLFPGDVEQAKRDDDHKRNLNGLSFAGWNRFRFPMRRNVKKTLLCLVVFILLYHFFKSMPIYLKNHSPRPNYRPPLAGGRTSKEIKLHKTTFGRLPADGSQPNQSNEEGTTEESEHWFNGPIKFYQLSESLHAISSTRGASEYNENVLFAASSLKSASILLPLACEMSSYKRNHVHFAFLGRDMISMEMLKEVNGMKDGCDKLWFHGIHRM